MKKILLFLSILILFNLAGDLSASQAAGARPSGFQGLSSASKVWYALNAGLIIGSSWLAYRQFQGLERFYVKPLKEAKDNHDLEIEKSQACEHMNNRISFLLRDGNTRDWMREAYQDTYVASRMGDQLIIGRMSDIQNHINNKSSYGSHKDCAPPRSPKKVCDTLQHLGTSFQEGLKDFTARQKTACDRAEKCYEDTMKRHRENEKRVAQVRRYITGGLAISAGALGIYCFTRLASSATSK